MSLWTFTMNPSRLSGVYATKSVSCVYLCAMPFVIVLCEMPIWLTSRILNVWRSHLCAESTFHHYIFTMDRLCVCVLARRTEQEWNPCARTYKRWIHRNIIRNSTNWRNIFFCWLEQLHSTNYEKFTKNNQMRKSLRNTLSLTHTVTPISVRYEWNSKMTFKIQSMDAFV